MLPIFSTNDCSYPTHQVEAPLPLPHPWMWTCYALTYEPYKIGCPEAVWLRLIVCPSAIILPSESLTWTNLRPAPPSQPYSVAYPEAYIRRAFDFNQIGSLIFFQICFSSIFFRIHGPTPRRSAMLLHRLRRLRLILGRFCRLRFHLRLSKAFVLAISVNTIGPWRPQCHFLIGWRNLWTPSSTGMWNMTCGTTARRKKRSRQRVICSSNLLWWGTGKQIRNSVCCHGMVRTTEF